MAELEPVQMLWIGARLRRMEQVCLQSFLDVGHPLHLFTYAPVAGVPDAVVIMDANAILAEREIFTYQLGSGKGSYAAFANLFRYKLLLDRGGWWVDTDVFCIKPWVFSRDYVFSLEPSDAKYIHNGIIRAPAAAPEMEYLYKVAKAHDPAKLRWGQTGSTLMTRAAQKFPAIRKFAEPSTTFCPINWTHVARAAQHPPTDLSPDAYGVHLFQEMWRRRNIDRDTNQPIFGWLQTKQKRGTDDSTHDVDSG